MAKRQRERPPPEYSNPTPERLRHAGADLHDNWKEAIAGSRRPPPIRLITIRDHPLERMLARKAISESQFAAGDKLRNHYERMLGRGRIGSVDWESIFASDPSTRYGGFKPGPDRQKFWAAWEYLGNVPAALVVSVCCEGRTLESIAPDFGRRAAGSGLKVVGYQLGLHLNRLTVFWGL